jgi:MFS family permease
LKSLRIVAATLVLQFAYGQVYVWGVLAPYVRAEAQWPALLIGAVWSATPIGWIVGIVVAGRVADRQPPRRLLWTGMGISTAAFLVTFLAPSGLTMVVFYAGLGLGLGGALAMAGSVAAGAQAFPRHVGAVGGAMTASYAVAALVQVPIASALAPHLGWLGTLRAMVIVLMPLAAALLLLMPSLPPPPQAASLLPSARIGAVKMLSRPAIITACLVELCAGALGAFVFVNLATHVGELGFGAALGAAAVTAVGAGNTAGRLAAGAASDRFGLHPVLLSVLLLGLGGAVLLVWPHPLLLLLAALAFGTGYGGAAGAVSRLAAQAAPEAPNSAFGLIFAGYSTGSSLGPLVGSLVPVSLSWGVVAIFPAAGLAILAYRRRLPSPEVERIEAEQFKRSGSPRA